MNRYTLIIIVLLRLLSALPFAVYYSSLQLYLLSAHFSQNLSTSLVGSVLALSFGTSLIGGVLAGKYINYRNFFLFCVICQAIGCFTFTTLNHHDILLYSAFFLLGSSGLTVSLNMMITQRFEPQDYSREKAFFWLYMSLNVGYLLGYSLAGYYGNINAYHHIILFILTFSTVSILLTALNWRHVDKSEKCQLIDIFKFTLIMMLLFLVIRLLLQYSHETNIVIIMAWITISTVMLCRLITKFPAHKNEITAFYILLISALIFWSAYFLAPMALIVFIKNHVNLQALNLSIAPQWIQNINTGVIILGTIIIGSKIKARLFNTRIIIAQFSIGLASMGVGFGLLALGIAMTHSPAKIPLIWIILSYVLQSIGELFIGPIGYALIGRLIPKAHHSLMMGIWVTLLGVASAVASQLSSIMPYFGSHADTTLMRYQNFFLIIFLIATILATTVFLGGKKLVKQPLQN